jgi:hypothetical protein
MNMKRHFLLLAVLLVAATSAFGWAGPITSPQLGFPQGTPPETIKKVIDYLQQELTFVEGSFINEFSNQAFSGTAKQVTGLIQLLERSGFDLTVKFFGDKDNRVALRISQNARPNEAILFINTAKKDLDLSGLVIHLPAWPPGVQIDPANELQPAAPRTNSPPAAPSTGR